MNSELRKLSAQSAREISDQLNAVVTSKSFAKSDRMARFLRFLVESKLATGSTPKEREIAKSVFDREKFDPRLDPIVRVEAGRLRRLLRSYYETDGADDTIVFSLATRGYSLRYGTPAPAGELDRGRSLAVLPFENLTDDPATGSFCSGITQEITNALTHVESVKVAPRSSVRQFHESRDVRALGQELGVDSILEGTVRMEGDRFRVTAQLSSVIDGLQYWSHSFDGEMAGALETQELVGVKIADVAGERLHGGDPLHRQQAALLADDAKNLSGRSV